MRGPGRPLPPEPSLAQDPAWLFFSQNNVPQAGGLGLLAQESSFLLSSWAAAGPLAWGCTGHRWDCRAGWRTAEQPLPLPLLGVSSAPLPPTSALLTHLSLLDPCLWVQSCVPCALSLSLFLGRP